LHHLVHKVCCLKILLPSFDNAELLLTARFVLHVKRITKLHLRIATASEVSISPPGNNKFLNMKVFYFTYTQYQVKRMAIFDARTFARSSSFCCFYVKQINSDSVYKTLSPGTSSHRTAW